MEFGELSRRCAEKTIILCCAGGFRGALNWAPLMPRDASLSDSYKSNRWRFSCLAVFLHWENYISNSFHIECDCFPFDFEPNGILFVQKIERKAVTTIISHSKGNENIVFSVHIENLQLTRIRWGLCAIWDPLMKTPRKSQQYGTEGYQGGSQSVLQCTERSRHLGLTKKKFQCRRAADICKVWR